MKSAVAGIIDSYGGLRVIVGRQKTFKYNKRHDELLFVVPGLRIEEPVPWNMIPWMIRQVQLHIANWIATRNDPDHCEHIKMYLLRCLEQDPESLNLHAIAET